MNTLNQQQIKIIENNLKNYNYKASSVFNEKLCMDGLKLLTCIPEQTTKVVFFDPQYRGILDNLKYGNEGKNRGKARSKLQQMSELNIQAFIFEINRILKESSYLFLWIDKFHLCEGIKKWIVNTKLKIVDLIVWNKERMGMGYRSRRTCEYLLILQKYPYKAKSTWKTHNIRDVWSEKINNKMHTHHKPYELQKALLLATSELNDIVIDPAAGSFVILEICKEINRKFLGCDLKV